MHIKRQRAGENRLFARLAPQPLRFRVGFNQCYLFCAATGELHIAQRDVIDRKKAAGRTILRRHISDGGAIRQRQIVKAVAVKLNEFTDNAMFTQHLRNGQHQVGSGNARTQLAGQLKAHHIRDQHRYRLTQHGGLRLNAAYAPPQHAEAVDHRGMGIGANQRIGISDLSAVLLFMPDSLTQIFKVNLMADAGAGRHDAELVEGFLPPTQENVTLVVALHLKTDVFAKRIVVAKAINGDRVVDYQIHRRKRIHARHIAAETFNRLAHRRQIHDRRHTGKILHQYARGTIGDLAIGMGGFLPVGQRLNIFGGNRAFILPAQQVFQQNFQGFR